MQTFKIAENELKVFAKIISTFQKLGRAVTITFRTNHIHLTVVDSRNSSYAQIRIAGTLSSCSTDDATNDDNRLRDEGHCIPLADAKSVANLCGTASDVPKSMKILIDKKNAKLSFTVYYDQINPRTRSVHCKVTNNLKDFSQNLPRLNEVKAPQSLFSNAIQCLKLESGITFIMDTESVLFQPFSDSDNTNDSLVSKVLLLDSQFTQYSVNEVIDLHFRVSYLKAVLGFAKAMKVLVTLNFDPPGSLGLFTLQTADYRAEFFLGSFDRTKEVFSQNVSFTRTPTQNRQLSHDISSNGASLTGSTSHRTSTRQQQRQRQRPTQKRTRIRRQRAGAPSRKRTKRNAQ